MLSGLDQLFSSQLAPLRRRLRNERVAVLTHAAAVDRRARTTLTVLEELGVSPVTVFTPEHGLNGIAQAQEPVLVDVDEAREVAAPIVSLYGKTKGSLAPSASDLSNLDLFLIDLADVGSRYYTFAWTALLSARAAQAAGVHTVILDRPNPVTGDPSSAEGKPQRDGYLSFVGLEPVPIRHALTLGELVAHFFDRDGLSLGPDGALSVVPVQGWERYRTADAWGRPFVMPSPNMPTLETALVYPGGCLVEGTNLSEGRGTTVPFRIVGAPFINGHQLAASMNELGTPGAQVRPVSYRPWFDKHQGSVCHGVMLHVTNAALFRPVATYLRLLTLAHRQAPDSFAFSATPYEFETEIPAFDLLTGSPDVRQAIRSQATPEEVVALAAPVPADWGEVVRSAEARLERAMP
ncbi:MAG: DUF1343 domain-containing protein [Polyangiaceae bacterium]|nr:DUF1343 domain-containing protein [Polyangiaceae bacterium]